MNSRTDAHHRTFSDEPDRDPQLQTALAALLTINLCNLRSLEQRLEIDLSRLKQLAKQCVRDYAHRRGLSDDDLDAASSSVRIQARRREREETRTPQRQAN